jgi:hypothetical protein
MMEYWAKLNKMIFNRISTNLLQFFFVIDYKN